MKFTQVPSTTFQEIQLNAGILLSDFDPSEGTLDPEDIIGATSGGINFTATPTYIDFGEDIDNVPNNTMELKRLDYFESKMSGTFVTVSSTLASRLVGAADIYEEEVTPRTDLTSNDFDTLWWVGDYSDKNGNSNGGFLAIQMLNTLSTGGFQIQSNDRGKGQFSFEFTAHYSLEQQDSVPFSIFVKQGEAEPASSAPNGDVSNNNGDSGVS